MDNISYIDLIFYTLLGLAIIGLVYVILRLYQTKLDLASSELIRKELAQGEKRMFDFLHHLGLSTAAETTPQKLHKLIVDGVQRVSQSEGAALYLLDQSGLTLRPASVTADCIQLISDPDLSPNEKLESIIKHTSVSRYDGVLGYALATNAPFKVDSLRAHPCFLDQMVSYSAEGAAMVAPLTHAGKQIGVLAVTKESCHDAYSIEDLFTFKSIAEQSAFAIGNFKAHHQAAEKKRLENELQTAQEVQRVLIPEKEPEIPGFKVFGYNVPASMISGDYFDYTAVSDNETGIIIADVSGKGVPAGIIMATFRSTLKAISKGASAPSEGLDKLNRLIYPDVREDMFISAIYTHLNHTTGEVTLARAGHNPAYFFKAESCELHKIKPPGLAVGIDEGDIFATLLKDHQIQMKSGDTLLLYTDGIIEANNRSGEEFSSLRLEDIARNQSGLGAHELGLEILDSVDAFVDGAAQSDDITLVVIERL